MAEPLCGMGVTVLHGGKAADRNALLRQAVLPQPLLGRRAADRAVPGYTVRRAHGHTGKVPNLNQRRQRGLPEVRAPQMVTVRAVAHFDFNKTSVQAGVRAKLLAEVGEAR